MFRLTIVMTLNFSPAVMYVLNSAIGDMSESGKAIYNTSIPITVCCRRIMLCFVHLFCQLQVNNSRYSFDPPYVYGPGSYVFTANVS